MSRVLATILCVATLPAVGEDWPVYRHDVRRSGQTSENLDVERLDEAWVIRSSQPPRPAWPGPAKWDAYAQLRGLRAMRDYDKAFHVTVANGMLFYGSSSDDAVHCIDARSGEERWAFITDGPVRIAPTLSDGRAYFGSDDGHAYCVDAETGRLVWKSAQLHDEQLILNNGRFISHWPCRTGVLVADGTAYFGLSLLPWRRSWLLAVDAETGKVEGAGRFQEELVNQTLEGGMLLQGDTLIALRGRVSPFLFDRSDGSDIGALKDGGGGMVATLNSEGEILHGPGNKTGWITRSSLSTRQKVETASGRVGVLALGDVNLYLSDEAVSAINNTDNKPLWQTAVDRPTDIIACSEHVIVGRDGHVLALRLDNGHEVWREPVHGRVYGLAVADGRLFASTDEGSIHCFAAGAPGNPASPAAKTTKSTRSPAKASIDPDVPIARDGLFGRWTFHSGMSDRAKRRGLSTPARRVQGTGSSLSGLISGNVQLREVGGVEALELDGRTNSVLLTQDLQAAKLPTRAISAEAWVRIDTPLRWGGIVGAMQDNGSYERGWLLGYQNSQFSFAVAAEGGPDKLNYLTGKTTFEPQLWYHVVGTYDGETQNVYVNGELEASSTAQRGPIQYPPDAFFEMGSYHDKDENFRMTGLLHEVAVYRRSLSAEEVRANYIAKRSKFPVPIRLARGPHARFEDPQTAVIRWATAKPSPTILELSGHGESRSVVDSKPKLEHRAIVRGLKRERVGSYVIRTNIDGKQGTTQAFELDSSFNYTTAGLAGRPDFGSAPATTERARLLIQRPAVRQGLCVVMGLVDGSLACEIARASDLHVVCVDDDIDRVNSVRKILLKAGVYGTRISVRHVSTLANLPFVGRCANLVVSEQPALVEGFRPDAREVFRILRPFGGVARFDWDPDTEHPSDKAVREWLHDASEQVEVRHTEGVMTATFVRPGLPGAGEWSHLYGRADNSAFGGETLAGASTVNELDVQWIGRPGPRAQPDRNGRKPSPLSRNGRLFVQGLHRLIGVDAFNGTPLWSLEIPSLERFNMPRDCGNWCADDDRVFVAIRNRCWSIDAQTGRIDKVHDVIDGDRSEWSYDWGYVARAGDILLGSAVKQGTAYTNFWGSAEAGWYDARSGSTTFKVCSENLFGLDPRTGEKKWEYASGLIVNSTITASADSTYFVECRNPAVKASTPRRVGMAELWQDQYLVSINTKTGRKEWEQPIDTADGIVVFNMALGGDHLVLSSSTDKKYYVYAFSSKDGQQIWEQSFGWPGGKGDHGKAMSRPAVVGDTVYVRPRALNLETGRILPLTMPGGGCGTYAATTEALFFRSGNVTAWNAVSGSTTSWNRLRPGCWLSTIPANGMLLSPEAGGGCSCGSWLETSVGFMPNREPDKK